MRLLQREGKLCVNRENAGSLACVTTGFSSLLPTFVGAAVRRVESKGSGIQHKRWKGAGRESNASRNSRHCTSFRRRWQLLLTSVVPPSRLVPLRY
jgi:hypothetical protein